MRSNLGRSVGEQSDTGISRPRLLVLSTRSPFSPRGGDQVRLLGLLRAAVAIGDTTLAIWGEPGGSTSIEEFTVQRFSVPKLVALLGVIGQGIRDRPLILGPYVRGFPVIPGRWDLVIGFQLKTWRWAQVVPASVHVLDMVDSLSRYREAPELPIRKKWQLRGVRREEEEARAAFDQVWVSSEADRDYLATMADVPMQVVPNGPLQINPLPQARKGKRLLFVGNHTYPPNRQGIEWFLREIWPELQREGFNLDLVGEGSQRFGNRLGVRGCGQVDAIEPFYAQARCVISPVWWGGGSQSKIWEALGYGRRIVVRPEGAGGIAPRVGIEVASGREEWVRAVRQIVTDPFPFDPALTTVTARMDQALRDALSRQG